MENAKDIIIEYLKYLWKEVTYLFVTIVYLISLSHLNGILLSKNFSTFYDILGYDNCKPIWFFTFALLLFCIGILLIYIRLKRNRSSSDYYGYYDLELNPLQEVIVNFIAMIVVVILLILIIVYIQVPILRAIMTAIIIGAGIGLANSK